MTRPVTLFLADPERANAQINSAWQKIIKPKLQAGHRLEVEIREERRSEAANAKLHAELAEIARSVEWAGAKRDTEVWKRLMTAAWLRTRGENIELLPAIDGHGIDVVFRRTSYLSKEETADLIEFILAWKAEQMPAEPETTPKE